MANTLYIICGPTANGKTSLSIALAQKLNCSIISFDSRQFFKEMSIGTAAPSIEERSAVEHHFIQDRSVEHEFSAGAFEKEVIDRLEELFLKSTKQIAVGGSGLYMYALTQGFDDLPQAPHEIRKKYNHIHKEEGIAALQEILKERDPVYASQVDLMNPHRLIRALEVIEVSGNPFSSLRKKLPKERNFETEKIAISWPREELYERINVRVLQMIQKGLVEEVKNLLPYRKHSALATVGYQEIFAHLDGEYELDRAIELIQRNTRRYAKRQLTWLRKDKSIQWIERSDLKSMLEEIEL